MALRLGRLASLACVAALAAACVPRGDPPAGRQLVADRTAALVGMVRPNGDGATRLLVTRPGQDPMTVDLSVITADAAGGPPSERVLAAGLHSTFSVDCQIWMNCFPNDARGRVFLTTAYDMSGTGPGWITTRIDPLTGDRLELGAGAAFQLSPSGERLLVSTPVSNASARMYQNATLYEADDRAVALGTTNYGLFIGEDLYYVTAQQELMRLVPGGVPELLSTGIGFFNRLTLEGDLLLELVRSSADLTSNTYSIFDAVTLEETASPFGSTPFAMLTDGRWLLALDFTSGSATFIERVTGAEDVFTPPPEFGIGGLLFRPGHDEVWFSDGQYPQPTLWIKKPGGPAVESSGLPYEYADDSGGSSSFTRDGAYWFSSRAPAGERPIVQVGSADDPNGARFDVVPAGANSDQYWQLADGRLLVPSWIDDGKRANIYAVSPVTGETQLLGEEGMVIVIGQTRLMASLHVIDGRGDLAAIELGSGRATVLAQEFAMGALVEPQGADRVATGAHVAYQFQARFASPYDGIWLATIP
jgi:hypothetical protein